MYVGYSTIYADNADIDADIRSSAWPSLARDPKQPPRSPPQNPLFSFLLGLVQAQFTINGPMG